MRPATIHLIAAARPNFMKVAPMVHAFRGQAWAKAVLVHTGQHYDPMMSDTFFDELSIGKPDIHLNIGSGTHAEQTGGVMIAYEKVCQEERPDWIVVVGDVNSTLACALVGAKLHIPVAHLEAGLRSRDRRMPEEINRLATDAVADLLLTPSPDGDENLRSEGVPAERIVRVGNIMIDSFELMRRQIEQRAAFRSFSVEPRGYGVITLHRPSNVDARESLERLVDEIALAARDLPMVFPVHPRTRQRLEHYRLLDRLGAGGRVRLAEPVGYVDFMSLVSNARLIVTDSGGVQEETTYLGIPCLTVRDTTERPITVSQGTNRLVPAESLGHVIHEVLAAPTSAGRCPELWDGRTAGRVVEALRERSAA